MIKWQKMVKMGLCFMGAVVLVISSSTIGVVGAGEVKEIKIGILLPFTGSVAIIGMHNWRGHELAVKEINEAGGIKSLGGAKLKLIKADSCSDPKIGMIEAERLILKDKVVCIMGAYQSSVTYPSSAIAEKYKIPYINPVAVKDEITERGFKYIFRIASKASWWAREALKYGMYMAEESGVWPKTIGFVYENTDWGKSTVKGYYEYMKKIGLDKKIKVVLDEPYPADAPDLTPVVLKIKAKKPDLIMFVSYTGDAIKLTNEIAKYKINCMAMIGNGAGHADPVWIKNTGKNCEYTCSITEFYADSTDPLVLKERAAFKKEYGYPMPEPSVNGYAATYVLADALERCASIDPQKINEALHRTHITEGPATIVPLTPNVMEFDEGGQSINAALVGIQVQKGEFKTVWPKEIAPAGNKIVYPIPNWSERK